MLKAFFIKPYGCKLNQYHALILRQNLINAGFIEESSFKNATVCIAISCVVTEKAEKEVRSALKKWKKNGKEVFAAGCFGRSLTEKLRSDGVIFGSEELVFSLICQSDTIKYDPLLNNTGEKSRAFVKIQQGCNQFCSYCIVPYTRGSPISRDKSQILDEIEVLCDSGIKEIVLTGTQIGLYHQIKPRQVTLLDLLQCIEQKFSSKLYRARLSSIHPNFVTQALLEFISTSSLWCNHLHISLQSGSNNILKAMNRKYTTEDYMSIIQTARLLIPGFLVSTDLIVGFPGETEQDFEDSCDFVRKIQFSKIHVFPYSSRFEASSHLFECQLDERIIQNRKRTMLELSKCLSYNLNCTFVGKKVEVLVERDCTGFTRNYKKVILNRNKSQSLHEMLGVIVSDCNEEVLLEG